MLTRRRILLLALGASLLLAACGGEGEPSGEDARVRETVIAYFRAVDAGDGAAICDRLTQDARRVITALQSATCEQAMTEASRQLPGSFNDYRLGSARIEGDQATLAVTAAGSPDEIRLESVGGEWKISDAPGLGTSPAPE